MTTTWIKQIRDKVRIDQTHFASNTSRLYIGVLRSHVVSFLFPFSHSIANHPADNEDFSLAFQVLETARVIYARHYTGPGQVKEEVAADSESEQKEGAAAASAAAAAAPISLFTSDAPVVPDDYTMSQKDIGLGLAFTYELLAQWFL